MYSETSKGQSAIDYHLDKWDKRHYSDEDSDPFGSLCVSKNRMYTEICKDKKHVIYFQGGLLF